MGPSTTWRSDDLQRQTVGCVAWRPTDNQARHARRPLHGSQAQTADAAGAAGTANRGGGGGGANSHGSGGGHSGGAGGTGVVIVKY